MALDILYFVSSKSFVLEPSPEAFVIILSTNKNSHINLNVSVHVSKHTHAHTPGKLILHMGCTLSAPKTSLPH